MKSQSEMAFRLLKLNAVDEMPACASSNSNHLQLITQSRPNRRTQGLTFTIEIRHVVFGIVLLCAFCAGQANQNITTILSALPDYSTLNSLLSQTGVAAEINSRNSLTLLALDNGALAPVAARLGNDLNLKQVADILRYNVLLQYYNPTQLSQLPNGTTLTPTLYQSTGRAAGQLGFVNLTDGSSGAVNVGLPIAGAGFNATILKQVQNIPYNISILQLSNAIVPVGVLASAPVPAPSPSPSPAPASAPTPVPAASPTPLSPALPPQPSTPSAASPTGTTAPASPTPSSSLPLAMAASNSAHMILVLWVALYNIV